MRAAGALLPGQRPERVYATDSPGSRWLSGPDATRVLRGVKAATSPDASPGTAIRRSRTSQRVRLRRSDRRARRVAAQLLLHAVGRLLGALLHAVRGLVNALLHAVRGLAALFRHAVCGMVHLVRHLVYRTAGVLRCGVRPPFDFFVIHDSHSECCVFFC